MTDYGAVDILTTFDEITVTDLCCHLGLGGAPFTGIAAVMAYRSTGDQMDGCTEPLDVFSYHYYNGVSERMAAMMPSAFTPFEGCMSEEYLGAAAHTARCFVSYQDKYCPGGEMWVTESGDAGAGGHTWASTYAEVVRTFWDQSTTVEIPGKAQVYTLTGTTGMRSRTMSLNGKELKLGENDEIPAFDPVAMEGTLEVAPGSCTFILV